MTRRPSPALAETADLLAPLSPEAAGAAGTEGHRDRMRSRLLKAGPEALADHEMLEMVLFLALPRRDTKPLARALLDRFHSFAAVIAAPVPALLAIEGMGEAAAAALKTVQAAALRLIRSELAELPILANWEKLVEYLRATLAHEDVEQVRVLYMDGRNRLLADEMQGRGTVNHTPLYPREVVRRALELRATAVVVSHNHPSGDPTPSREDIAMTRELKAAVEALRIALHDHVIIAGSNFLSFKQQGLL
ncbi:MAG TPA: DNA repair protein RadC [Acetobacteraceae bacterium]|nr:DNA repair protein RadC [Acetobacteraceae bacterium]